MVGAPGLASDARFRAQALHGITPDDEHVTAGGGQPRGNRLADPSVPPVTSATLSTSASPPLERDPNGAQRQHRHLGPQQVEVVRGHAVEQQALRARGSLRR